MPRDFDFKPKEPPVRKEGEPSIYEKYKQSIDSTKTPFGIAGGNAADQSITRYMTPEELGTYREYGVNYKLTSENNERFRAENQPVSHKVWRSLNPLKLTASIGLGILENIGYIGAMAYDQEQDYSNALTEWAKTAREGLDNPASSLAGSIAGKGASYRVNPDKVWDAGDPAWWLQHASGLLESAGEFIATGYGVGGVLGKTGNLLAKTVRAGQLGRGIIGASNVIANASTLAYVEGAMSGSEIYRQVYDKHIQDGYSNEEATQLAADAAAATVRTNTVVNTFLNLSAAAPFIKGMTTAKRVKSLGLQRTKNESTAAYIKRLQQAAETNEAVKPLMSSTLKHLGLEALQEGNEELVNLYSEKIGRVKGQIEEGEIGLADFFEESFTEEGALSFVLGAFGGIAQTVGTQNIPFYKQIKKDENGKAVQKKDKEGNIIEGQFETEYKSVRSLKNDAKMKEYTGYVSDLLDDLTSINADMQQLQELYNDEEISIEEKESKAQEIKDRMFAVSLRKSLYTGTAENLIQTYEEIEAVTNTLADRQKEQEYYQQELLKLQEQYNNPDLTTEEKQQLDTQIDSVRKRLETVTNTTEAEEKGLSKRGDDSYKDEARNAIEKIRERSQVYEEYKAKYSYGEEETYRLPDYMFNLYNASEDLKEHSNRLSEFINNSIDEAGRDSERTRKVVEGAAAIAREEALKKHISQIQKDRKNLDRPNKEEVSKLVKRLGAEDKEEAVRLLNFKEKVANDMLMQATSDVNNIASTLSDEETQKIKSSAAYQALESELTGITVEQAETLLSDLSDSFEENEKLLEELIEAPEEEEEGITLNEAINTEDRLYTFNGERGKLRVEGKTVVFETGERIYELGNVDETAETAISQLGLQEEERINVEVSTDYSVTIDGVKYVNNYSNPLSAVSETKDGESTVSLETEDGKKRTFRGGRAEEIALQYRLLNLEENGTDEQIERLEREINEAEREAEQAGQEQAEGNPQEGSTTAKLISKLSGEERERVEQQQKELIKEGKAIKERLRKEQILRARLDNMLRTVFDEAKEIGETEGIVSTQRAKADVDTSQRWYADKLNTLRTSNGRKEYLEKRKKNYDELVKSIEEKQGKQKEAKAKQSKEGKQTVKANEVSDKATDGRKDPVKTIVFPTEESVKEQEEKEKAKQDVKETVKTLQEEDDSYVPDPIAADKLASLHRDTIDYLSKKGLETDWETVAHYYYQTLGREEFQMNYEDLANHYASQQGELVTSTFEDLFPVDESQPSPALGYQGVNQSEYNAISEDESVDLSLDNNGIEKSERGLHPREELVKIKNPAFTIAYKTKEFENIEEDGTIVGRRTITNELYQYTDPLLLSSKEITKGDKLIIREATAQDDLNPIALEELERYKEDPMNRPVVVEHVKTGKIFFIHKLDWMTEDNVVEKELAKERDALIRLRQAVAESENGIEATISYKGSGHLSYNLDEETNTPVFRKGDEVFEDDDNVDFAIAKGKVLHLDNDTTVDKSSLVNNKTKFISTAAYALLTTPSGEKFAKMLPTATLTDDDIDNVINILRVYTSQNEEARNEIKKQTGIDIFTPTGIAEALSHYVHTARFNSDVLDRFKGSGFKYLNVVNGVVYWAEAGFHTNSANAGNLDSKLNSLRNHLRGMYRHINVGRLDKKNFKRLRVDENGNVSTQEYAKYTDYVKESVFSELRANDLGNGERSFFDQPNIYFDTKQSIVEEDATEEETQEEVVPEEDTTQEVVKTESGLEISFGEGDVDENTLDSPFFFSSTASLIPVNTPEVQSIEKRLNLRHEDNKLVRHTITDNQSRDRLLNRVIKLNDRLAEIYPEYRAATIPVRDSKGKTFYAIRLFKRFEEQDNPSIISSGNQDFEEEQRIRDVMERLSKGLVIAGINPRQQQQIAQYFASHINKQIKEAGNKSVSITGLLSKLHNELKPLKEKNETLAILVDDVNWEILSRTIIRNLYNASTLVAVKSRENDQVEETLEDGELSDSEIDGIEVEQAEEKVDWTSDRAFKINPKSTLTSRFKNFLAFIEEGKASIGGFGVKTFVDSNKAYNDMLSILENTENTFEAKLAELEKHVRRLPYLRNVISELKKQPKDVQNAFVAGTDKHSPNFKRVMHSRDDDGNIYGVNVDANFSNAYKQVEQEWKQAFYNSPYAETYEDYIKRTGKRKEKGISNLDLIISPENRNEIVTAFTEFVKEKKYEDNEAIAEFMSRYLNITIPPAIWQRMRKDIEEGKTKFYQVESMEDLFTTKYGVIKKMIDRLVVGDDAKHTFLSIENNTIVDNNSSARSLAVYVASNADYTTPSSVRSGEGKIFYNYSANKYLTDRVKTFKYDGGVKAKELLSNPFSSTSSLLSALAKPNDKYRARFNYFTVDTLNPRNKPTSGVRLHKQSETQREFYKLALFQNRGISQGTTGKRMSNFLMPSMGKTTMMGIEWFAFNVDFNDDGSINANSVQEVRRAVQGEIARINYHNDLKREGILDQVNNQNWVEGGGKFIMFPFLNDVEELWEGERVLDDKAIIERVLLNEINKRIDEKIAKWEKYEIVNRENETSLIDSGYIEKVLKPNTPEGQLTFDQIVKRAAADMVINYIAFNANMFQAVIGDPALYWKNNMEDTKKNIEKRLANLIAPGDSQADNNVEYLQIFAKDSEKVSPIIAELTDLLDGKTFNPADLTKLSKKELKAKYPRSSAYMNINTTDAQEYITWRAHLNNLEKEGAITEQDKNNIIKIIESGKDLTFNQLQGVFNPVKPVYTGMHQMSEFNIEEFIYIKSSAIPLYPQLVRGSSKLEAIYNTMTSMEKKHKKDVHLSFESTTKLGLPLNDNLLDLEADTIEVKPENYKVLNKKNLRKQQEVPYKGDDNTSVDGSQKIKLIFNNIKDVSGFEYKGQKLKGQELEDAYIARYNDLFEMKKSELLEDIGYSEQTGLPNMQKLSNMLISEGLRLGYTTNELKYLKLNEDGTSFHADLWFSSIGSKVESFLTSIIDNRVRKTKVPGRAFVLGSEFGVMPAKTLSEADSSGVIWKDGYTPGTELAPDEIIIPMHLAEIISSGNLMEKIVTNGRIDLNVLPEELLRIVGYRIPTEDLHSIKSLKIVGFIPKASGDLVIASSHLIAQMGSDFDIDKLYSAMHSIYFDEMEGRFKKLQEGDVDRLIAAHADNLFNKITSVAEKAASGDANIMADALAKAGITEDVVDLIEIDEDNLEPLLSKHKFLKRLRNKMTSHAIYNDIIDIQQAILTNPDEKVRKAINNPTNYGNLPELRDAISATRTREDFILTDEYQSNLYRETNSAADAIGVMALNMTMHSQLQGKNVTLRLNEQGTNKFIFNGHKAFELSRQQTLDGKSLISDTHTALASASVDDTKEKILSSLNIGEESYDAIRIMVQLGFNLDEIMYFINQPSILELTDRIRQNKRKLEDATYKSENVVIEEYQLELAEKARVSLEANGSGVQFQLNPDYNVKLEDLKAVLEGGNPSITKEVFDANVVQKFIQATDLGRSLATVQNVINADSKGVGKDIFDVVFSIDNLTTLDENPVFEGIHKIVGEYTFTEQVEGSHLVKDVYIRPTTIHGLASIHARSLAYDLFANSRKGSALFPYGKRELSILYDTIFKQTGLEDTVKNRKRVVNELKKYLTSSPDNPIFRYSDLREERDRLLIDKTRLEQNAWTDANGVKRTSPELIVLKKSLATRVNELKKQRLSLKTGENSTISVLRFKNNAFLNLIKPVISTKSGEISTLEFNKPASLDFDQEQITQDFIQLFIREEGVSEEQHREAMQVAKDIISYGYLTGASRQKNDFLKYVPIEYLESLGFIDFLNSREITQESLDLDKLDKIHHIPEFVLQFIQHNPHLVKPDAIVREEQQELFLENKNEDGFFVLPPAVKSGNPFKYMVRDVQLKGRTSTVQTYSPIISVPKLVDGATEYRLFKRISADENVYTEIPVLGRNRVDEYIAGEGVSETVVEFARKNNTNVPVSSIKGTSSPLKEKVVQKQDAVQPATGKSFLEIIGLKIPSSGIMTVQGDNLGTALRRMSSDSLTEFLAEVAVKNGVKVKFSNEFRTASYSPTYHSIKMPVSKEGHRSTEIIKHEIVHSEVSSKVKEVIDYLNKRTEAIKPDSNVIQAVKRLQGLQTRIIKMIDSGQLEDRGYTKEGRLETQKIYYEKIPIDSSLTAEQKEAEIQRRRELITKYYPLMDYSEDAKTDKDTEYTNLNEFIADVMSNSELQMLLNDIKANGKQKSMLQKFVDYIMDILKTFKIVRPDGTTIDLNKDSELQSALEDVIILFKGEGQFKNRENVTQSTDKKLDNPAFLNVADTKKRLSKALKERENRVRRLENYISNELTKESNYTDEKKLAKLSQLILETSDQVAELKEGATLIKIREVAEYDMELLNKIVNQEESEISDEEIELAGHVASLWSNIKDILFTEEEVRLDKEGKSSANMEMFRGITDQATSYQVQVDKIALRRLKDYIKNNLGHSVKEEEIEAFKDINGLQKYFLDITHYDNKGLSLIDNFARTASQKTNHEFLQMAKKIDEMMKKLPSEHKNFNFMLQEDEKGRPTGNIVSAYSKDFFDAKYKLLGMAKRINNKTMWNKYFDFIKQNEVFVDPRQMFIIKNGEYVLKNNPEYEAKLKEQLGSKYDSSVERALRMINEYHEKRQAQETFINESDRDAAAKAAALERWEIENSPFVYLDSIENKKVKKVGETIVKQKGYESLVSVPKRVDDKGNLTGWHDSKYEAIQNNPALKEFYDFTLNTLNTFYKFVPESKKRNLHAHTLPFVTKNFMDVFRGKDGKKTMQFLNDKLVDLATRGNISEVTYDVVDTVTGKKEKKLDVLYLDFDQKVTDLTEKKVLLYAVENDLEVKNVPGDVRKKLRKDAIAELNDERSLDIEAVLKAFAASAIAYKHKSRVETPLKIAYNVINNALERKMAASGRPQKDKYLDDILQKDGLANLKTSLDYYVETFYGKKNKDEGVINKKLYTAQEKKIKKELEAKKKKIEQDLASGKVKIENVAKQLEQINESIADLGKKIVLSSVGRMLLNYNQLKGMGWNIFSATANLGFGWVSNLVHAAGNEDYSTKHLLKAKALVSHSIATSASDYTIQKALRSKTSRKIAAIVERFDMVKEINEANYGRYADNKSSAKGLAKFMPLELQKRSEFIIQAEMGIATLLATEIKEGVSVWDALDDNGNLKPEYKDMKEWDWDTNPASEEGKKMRQLKFRIDQLSKTLHGNYDYNSPIYAKASFAGKAALQFRSWMAEGIANRWQGVRYDDLLGRKVKGRWRSFFALTNEAGEEERNLIKPILITGQNMLNILTRGLVFKEAGSDLDSVDKANLRKNAMEMIIYGAMWASLAAMKAAATDDDDEEAYLNFLMNVWQRVETDITFYISPTAFEDITKNTVPLMSLLTDTGDFILAVNKAVKGEDEIQSGIYKGDSRLLRETATMLPLGRSYFRMLSTTEQVYD